MKCRNTTPDVDRERDDQIKEERRPRVHAFPRTVQRLGPQRRGRRRVVNAARQPRHGPPGVGVIKLFLCH